MFEHGLPAVASDTICFPAKLVHGHVRDLERMRVDRIFMPSITTVPTENTEKTSESMCAVVKGYAIVMRNSDNPEKRFGVPFDSPLFHWYSARPRRASWAYLDARRLASPSRRRRPGARAGDVQRKPSSKTSSWPQDARVIEQVRREGGYAVVLASRPYHNDPLVNHDLPGMFTSQGIPVLTPDAVPGIDIDLSNSRIDIVNNYHARMLGSAVIAASSPHLEYVQLVSFGCGHDAYLSDEIVRIMHEITDKSPLVLKVDESDVPGPLRIRIRSFVETIDIKRQERSAARRSRRYAR